MNEREVTLNTRLPHEQRSALLHHLATFLFALAGAVVGVALGMWITWEWIWQ